MSLGLEKIASDWAQALAPVTDEFSHIDEFLQRERAAGQHVLPAEERILAAFQRPLADVRVLIVGQDPYPTPGHPIGMAFAADRDVRPLPRSIANIYRELHDDLGISQAPHADLSVWADRGVMLLNRVLTVRAGETGSHRRKGWEAVTEQAIRSLATRGGPLVAILWGNDARKLAPLLPDVLCIESAHPSPLSASRGFFGSRPFSRANAALESKGAEAVDWRLEPSGD
ncbi:MAG: uracil-DNA glycosylase [Leucobacter sp.]